MFSIIIIIIIIIRSSSSSSSSSSSIVIIIIVIICLFRCVVFVDMRMACVVVYLFSCVRRRGGMAYGQFS